jgi:hypothetical protein
LPRYTAGALSAKGWLKYSVGRKKNFCYDCAVFRQLAGNTLALRIYAVKSGV